jgi:DNA-binding SARP family transcriptional activator
VEPLRETAHRVVIRAHAAEGNLVEAHRQYRRFEDLLQRELGVAPSADIRALAHA